MKPIGLLREGPVLAHLVRPVSTSPGRTGFATQESRPGGPGAAASSRDSRHLEAHQEAQVCHLSHENRRRARRAASIVVKLLRS